MPPFDRGYVPGPLVWLVCVLAVGTVWLALIGRAPFDLRLVSAGLAGVVWGGLLTFRWMLGRMQ